MHVITHEDKKTRVVHVKDFKILGDIREIFFTPEIAEALEFASQEDATKVFNELVGPSNQKALRIQAR